MERVSNTRLKKIYLAIKNDKKKFLSLEALARKLGIYPEIIGEELSYFNPMVLMDQTINMKSLLPDIEVELKKDEEKKAENPSKKRVVVSKKEVLQFKSIASFVYAKMTGAGGLVDTSVVLDEKDLRILQKLVNQEIEKQKKPKKKSKAKQ